MEDFNKLLEIKLETVIAYFKMEIQRLGEILVPTKGEIVNYKDPLLIRVIVNVGWIEEQE